MSAVAVFLSRGLFFSSSFLQNRFQTFNNFLCMSFSSDCNQNVTSGYGHLTSPGYPVSYHSNHDCTTRLTSPPGTFLTLYFDNFVLEGNSRCPFDYLRVSRAQLFSLDVVLCMHLLTIILQYSLYQ